MTGWDDKMDLLRRRFVERTLADGSRLKDGRSPDRGWLEASAHRISGSAGMFGFGDLGSAAQALEDALRSGCSGAELRQHLDRFSLEIGRIQAP